MSRLLIKPLAGRAGGKHEGVGQISMVRPWCSDEQNKTGYDFDWAICRVAEVLDMPPAQVTAFGKSPQTVKARSLLCFWAHRRLGMSTIEIARKLRIIQLAVSRSSKRGEQIENEHRFELIPQKV